MKKILIGLVCCLSALSYADIPLDDEQKRDEKCHDLALSASIAMSLRQNGVSLSDVFDMVNKFPDESSRVINRAIVEDAYKQKQFTSQQLQDEANLEFAAKYFHYCMEMYTNSP